MFLSAYESIQACQMMEELLGQVKSRILDIYKLEFQVETWAQAKRSKEEKQAKWREAKRTEAAVFLRTFGALSEVYFLHAIYHFKAQEVRIERFKPCTIWSWNEEDIAFGRQLLQACAKFAQHLQLVRTLCKTRTTLTQHSHSPCVVRIFLCFSMHAPPTSQIFLAWYFLM